MSARDTIREIAGALTTGTRVVGPDELTDALEREVRTRTWRRAGVMVELEWPDPNGPTSLSTPYAPSWIAQRLYLEADLAGVDLTDPEDECEHPNGFGVHGCPCGVTRDDDDDFAGTRQEKDEKDPGNG